MLCLLESTKYPISIDPISRGAEKQLVRYIGHVRQSDLARVMREADYQMKKWAVGSEQPEIPDFRSVDRLTREHGLRYLEAARRFWFVPEDMRFRAGGGALLFDSGEMTVKTEYIQQTGRRARAEPADEVFARAFSERYGEIAAKYPVFEELFEYAKFVSLARHIKDNGVPLLWFLLANRDLALTETSPGTVDALIKESEYLRYVTIEGGVDLARHTAQESYVIDAAAVEALVAARRGAENSDRQTGSSVTAPTVTFVSQDRNYSVRSSNDVVVGAGPTGNSRYQTDVALRAGGQPSLELIRYYDPTGTSGDFGPGWHVMVPFRVEPAGKKTVPFVNAQVPERMRVEDLMTGRSEILTFSTSRYALECYVSSEPEASPWIAIVWMSNGSLRLLDKLGNEFQFDQSGRMTHMLISKDYTVEYLYDRERLDRGAFDQSPYRLRVDGDEMEEVANVMAPSHFVLVDEHSGSEETFVFDRDSSRNMAGWVPENGEASRYVFLVLMSDASFLLEDHRGGQVRFDGAGAFDYMSQPVVRALRQGDQRIEFEYEGRLNDFRIKPARVVQVGATSASYSVRYDYGYDGRLASVSASDGTKREINYEGPGTWITAQAGQ